VDEIIAIYGLSWAVNIVLKREKRNIIRGHDKATVVEKYN
jgi:hypothetical protein